MATLDRVIQMQTEGKSDTEIMMQLQNEGISPSEIQNSIQQAKVKSAVSPNDPLPPPQQEPTANSQEPSTSQMQPSIMPQAAPEQTPINPTPTGTQEEYYTPQPQAYSGEEYYPEQQGYGQENTSEIAAQVVTEYLEDYKQKVGDIPSFKNSIQNQVNNIDDRLKRIENTIDKLQQAILGKIGEYGESSAMIHKDLDNLHGTVSKLMDPLIDNVNELKKANKK